MAHTVGRLRMHAESILTLILTVFAFTHAERKGERVCVGVSHGLRVSHCL